MRRLWSNLQPRERTALALGGVALLLLLAYLWGIAPYQKEMRRLEASVARKQALLTWLRTAAAEVAVLRGRRDPAGRPVGASLLGLVDKTVKAAGLGAGLSRVQPDGRKAVRVWLKEVSFDALLTWLGGLQRRDGVRVEELVVERHPASGTVNVRLRLSRKVSG